MSTPYVIERLKEIASGENFDIPDGWKFYSYKCKGGAIATVTNELGETISDNGSASSFNYFPGGCKRVNISSLGGNVIIKWF